MIDLNIPFFVMYVVQGILVALVLAGPIYLIGVVVRLAKRQQSAAIAAEEQVRLQREALATLQLLLAEQRETNQRLDRMAAGRSTV